MASKPWTFFRAGGFDQVALSEGTDLLRLEELDQKLWVALACPTRGIELDARLLELIDTDHDGRIRAPELLAAAAFVEQALGNYEMLPRSSAELPLSHLNEKTALGKSLLETARQILTNLGKADATALRVSDFDDKARLFADSAFNGDGIITELSVSTDSGRAALADIIAALGTVTDRSGKPGVDAAKVEAFFAGVDALSAWQTAAQEREAELFPLGREATAAAANALTAIRDKVDDYFSRCRLAAFDGRAAAHLNGPEADYATLASHNLSASATEAGHLPLAQVAADRPLPLESGVNPAHREALQVLTQTAIQPLLGFRSELSNADWKELQVRLRPYLEWLAAKPSTPVAALSAERLSAVTAPEVRSELLALLERERGGEAGAQHIEDVERAVRYHQGLFKLATNFVSFQDFYTRKAPAIFQCGTLYIDQRACSLCLRVQDPAKHAAIAGLAGAYLAYVDCARPASGESFQIVAVVTDGDSDNLMVGRNGLFYDVHGKDYDATIVKIVDNPISIRQAFFAPYKKLVRLIEEQVAKRAAAADGDSHAKLAGIADTAANADKAAPAAAPAPKPVDVGAVAALGVAVAGIGTFFTAILGYASGILQLGLFATLLAILGLILLISAPSTVLAYVKLRKRNLGPLLDAGGWAINTKAKVNVPFGATLTAVPKLPAGAKRTTADAFAEKALPWKRYVLLVLVIYGAYKWFSGNFDSVLPTQLRRATVLQLIGVPATPPASAPAPAPAAKP